ncbi:MAG: PAAR domain-containing protein [Ferruginibacter sp.]|nr:PAAR domain-containing protein [Ferruginibacter sp.]
MGKPAARLMDMHTCPMVNGVVPHVGGPIMGPGCPTVLIGGMPAAVVGDMCTCTGPPDTIILGSAGVLIGGKPAARMGDMTSHGGIIILGCFTVLIGDAGAGGGGGGGAAAPKADMSKLGAKAAAALANKKALEQAAQEGKDTAEKTDQKDFNAQFTLVDEAEKGVANVNYEIETNDGERHTGKTDSSGKTDNLSGYTTADCRVSFLNK